MLAVFGIIRPPGTKKMYAHARVWHMRHGLEQQHERHDDEHHGKQPAGKVAPRAAVGIHGQCPDQQQHEQYDPPSSLSSFGGV